MKVRRTVAALAAAWAMTACKGTPDPAVGRAAAAKAAEHVAEGRGAVDRLATGLVDVMGKAARDMAPAMAEPGNVARVRNRLRDLHEERSEVGRELTLYPTWFIAAAGMDGKAIAGDREPDRDFLPGKDLAAAFPCVRAALSGTAGRCVGELSSGDGQEPRTYLVAVQPTRAPDNTVNGAVVGAITFGRLAKAVRELLNLRVGREQVQLYVGFVRDGRVIPSGRRDNDVAQAFLVPDSLVPRVPGDLLQRLPAGDGAHTFTFNENDGRLQWGAAAARVPTLGESTALVVFRAPLRQ